MITHAPCCGGRLPLGGTTCDRCGGKSDGRGGGRGQGCGLLKTNAMSEFGREGEWRRYRATAWLLEGEYQ